jgi:LPPG:FO 2-phospho-L-lactate transferase
MSRDLVVALSGGIGGAKLALGLSRIVRPDNLIVVANVGDDFEHLGLSISPDVDTLMYTLAGLDNTKLGWGRQDETWSFMETLTVLGGENWFRLGDRDLAVHVERTRRLRQGESLSAITADFCRRLGVRPRVAPATDDRVRTRLRTDEGWLDLQDYFVRLQCRPVVRELAFEGAEDARPHHELLAALRDERLRAVIICPSNPFISIEPILAVPGMRQALSACAAPIIAVSPIIGGRAVKGPTAKMMVELGMKGPTAKMMAELGITPSAAAVAKRYGDLIDGYVMDVADAEEAAHVTAKVTLAQTLMTNIEEREQLAHVVLEAADTLASLKRGRDLVA